METGSTLKANDLEVTAFIAPISARCIVNVASMKMKKDQIERSDTKNERSAHRWQSLSMSRRTEPLKKSFSAHEREKRKTDQNVTRIVEDVVSHIRKDGDKALAEYTEKFDHVRLSDFAVSKEETKQAVKSVDPALIKALERAAENIREYHEKQKTSGFIMTRENNAVMGQRVRGLDKVGLYVPGGTAAYPSSVLMNAIPAIVAGVKEIIMVTPPTGGNGKVSPNILAAAFVAGVDKIYKVGGAQAVAALAYGTESIPKVDKIVGPGNIFVAVAKRLVYGAVDIDMVAGPSEVLVLADESANPVYLAADLMSQAEHDALASSVLLTTSEKVAQKTIEELERQMAYLSRKDIIEKSLQNYGAVIVCPDFDRAIELANEIAPEHLEIITKDPITYLGRLDNAGSVFLGEYSPEPLGDYMAGPNHVLPTSGTARFFSPLSVDNFVKKMSFIQYSKEALEDVKDEIITIAESEKLTAHANSVKVRFE